MDTLTVVYVFTHHRQVEFAGASCLEKLSLGGQVIKTTPQAIRDLNVACGAKPR